MRLDAVRPGFVPASCSAARLVSPDRGRGPVRSTRPRGEHAGVQTKSGGLGSVPGSVTRLASPDCVVTPSGPRTGCGEHAECERPGGFVAVAGPVTRLANPDRSGPPLAP